MTLGFLVAAFASTVHAVEPLATSPSGEYFVAGEALHIDVPLDTGSLFEGGYAIDSAGYVDIPVLGRLYVHGKSRDVVEEYLGQKLSNYLKDTHIRVIPSIRLTLLGHWTRQGQYYVSPKATVWEAVYGAGGIGGERNLSELQVLRGSENLHLPLLDEYSRGRTLAAAGIRSGDIFMIPVPRDNAGFWYWFTQGLSATAQTAAIIASLATVYFIIDRSGNTSQ